MNRGPLRSLLAQVRLVLGRRGVVWLAAASVMGALCCTVTVIDVALSLGADEVRGNRGRGTAIRALEGSNRQLMRTLVVLSTDAPAAQTATSLATSPAPNPVPEQWARVQQLYAGACADAGLRRAYGPALAALCDDRAAFVGRVGPAIEAFAAAVRPFDKAAMRDIVAFRDELHDLGALVVREDDALARRLARQAQERSVVLGVSTAGFVAAGLILLVLLGRASRVQLAQADKVARSEALLRETIDALPAGVVVYDADERLMLFNSTAAELTPGLHEPGAIGRTYAQLAYQSARRLEAAGKGPQPVADWIARFRTRGWQRTRQAQDGRWFDWTEKATPGGLTVGLRVDVTELKGKQLELDAARAEFQSLVDSLADVVYKIDVATGRLTFVSAAAEEFFGESREVLVGTDCLEHVEPASRAMIVELGARPFDGTDQPVLSRFRMRAAGGEMRHVEARARRRIDAQGRLISTGVLRDIEDRVRLERRLEEQMAELQHARARYRSLVDALSDIVYTLDVASGAYTFISAAGAAYFGKPADEIVGRHFLDLIAPESRDYVQRTTQRDYRPDDPGTFARFSVIAAGGEIRHVEVRAQRRFEDGRLVSTGIMRDVEERVRLESHLEQERARLRSIVESSGALVALVDRDFAIVMVNSGFTALSGVAEAEAVGAPLRRFMELPPDIAGGAPVRFAVRLDDGAGGARLVSVTATPVSGAGGRPDGFVLLGVDDTERRAAEQALNDTERFATVGEMAGTMAHEISQPLQVINIACASAKDEVETAAADGKPADIGYIDGKLDRIAQQVVCASRIIDDLRNFVRGTADRQPGPFDPARAIRSAVALTAYGVRQAGAALVEAVPDGLPAVCGDPGRLEQLLVNLLHNARDAGGRSIRLAAAAVERDGRPFVHIAVEDSGHGIPADILPRLFVSFATTKAPGKGTGLGLRICRRIAAEMGGTISASNRPEGGARFDVLLPAAMP